MKYKIGIEVENLQELWEIVTILHDRKPSVEKVYDTPKREYPPLSEEKKKEIEERQAKEPASDKQKNFLKELGYKEDMEILSKLDANKKIDEILKTKK